MTRAGAGAMRTALTSPTPTRLPKALKAASRKNPSARSRQSYPTRIRLATASSRLIWMSCFCQAPLSLVL